jgi:hypothetical protein
VTATRAEHLELLRKLAAADPPPTLMGGYAEDALLYGGPSRDHNDIDFMVDRSGLDGLLGQLRSFGFESWTTKGENAAGEPFYLEQQAGGVLVEIGVTDRRSGGICIEIGRVHFTLATGEAPVGYRVYLPADSYDWPPTRYEDLRVHCASPLANYQLRAGIGSRGTFGPLRPYDLATMELLRRAFFPTAQESKLLPAVEDL